MEQRDAVRLVRQRNELDCGYAVAAMLAGVDYYTAGEADPTPEVCRGMYCGELAMMLGALTGSVWQVTKRGYGKSVREYRAAGGPVAAFIRWPGIARRDFGHWVVLNCYVYDPELRRRRTYEEYERGDWIIARILTPAPASPRQCAAACAAGAASYSSPASAARAAAARAAAARAARTSAAPSATN